VTPAPCRSHMLPPLTSSVFFRAAYMVHVSNGTGCLSSIAGQVFGRSLCHLLRHQSEPVHVVFSHVQDDDEFAVPANFGIIPDYLDSLDADIGQVVAPAWCLALPNSSHCLPHHNGLYANGESHTSAVCPASELQP